MANEYDIIVVGGGHAGYEAAHAGAKTGCRTLLISMDASRVGTLSCNPAIGGTAKGHLVKEIDALGGLMGRIADLSGMQFRMLNLSRGPAVWSPRAQVDRALYPHFVQQFLNDLENLAVVSGNVIDLVVELNRVAGVVVEDGTVIRAKSVILTCGTFLNGVIHIGLHAEKAGRYGEKSAKGITEALVAHGFESGRLKTGTPPRIHKDSIDFSVCQPQYGDDPPQPFSWQTSRIHSPQVPCHITHTSTLTHDVLKRGFDESPMYTGRIKGLGPRYCPSIEDKISRFADKERHQIFLEPEGYQSSEYYVNGFSTSLPERIQNEALRTVRGLENVRVLRPGYAVEYDFFPPYQLELTMESKALRGLFMAGQINGTSGYEEAGAQGIMAGINAALYVGGKEPLVLRRNEAYIGVLIDDLINKSTLEPYRIFTSLAEHRLLLRQDNADFRLTEKGYQVGLVSEQQYGHYRKKRTSVERTMGWINQVFVAPDQVNPFLKRIASSPLLETEPLQKLLRRPEVSLEALASGLDDLIPDEISHYLEDRNVLHELDVSLKYEGYLKRQSEQVIRFEKLEKKRIPRGFDYRSVKSLSSEAVDKLSKVRPDSVGQASRISGVTPADISLISVYLEKGNRKTSSAESS